MLLRTFGDKGYKLQYIVVYSLQYCYILCSKAVASALKSLGGDTVSVQIRAQAAAEHGARIRKPPLPPTKLPSNAKGSLAPRKKGAFAPFLRGVG